MMKKTLVALAAVAVTTGAFAQATMTGAVGVGYSSTISTANALASGMGVDDASANFAISEAIEGFGKLSAKFGVYAGASGEASSGNDMAITITNASGISYKVDSSKGASYLTQGVASAGTAYQWNLSGKLFSARSVKETVSVGIPLAEGLALSLAHTEGSNATTGYGVGAGAAGTTAQRENTASLNYAAGALVVNAGFRSFDSQTVNSSSTSASRTRGAASYDLGVAKVGAGFEQTIYTFGNKLTDTLVGVNVPAGALNIGAQIASRSATDNSSSSSNYDRAGYLLVANYALSKRTYVVANYYSYDGGTTINGSGYGLFLYNSF